MVAPPTWATWAAWASESVPLTPPGVAGTQHERHHEGLDAATGEYVDMIKVGIIDPAKVTRSALQNAASIAALFLTTEAVIADKPEKQPAGGGMPGGGGMGDMDF